MNTPFDFLFAGNNLTSLVAALELAKKGRKVALINPLPTWGGHFSSFDLDGFKFDPGSVSHELTSYNHSDNMNPADYNPAKRNDWGRFVSLIEDYTRSHLSLRRIDTPQTFFEGKCYNDIIMGNHFDILHHPSLSQMIPFELERLQHVEPEFAHARHKNASSFFQINSYEILSELNHGTTLHRCIFDSFYKKLTGLSSNSLIAKYHRVVWLPFFYPETLLSQFTNTPQELPPTHFFYPEEGYIGVLGDTIVEKLCRLKVSFFRESIERVEAQEDFSAIRLSSGNLVQGKQLVWSLSHRQLVMSSGEQFHNSYQNAALLLVFLTIPASRLLKSFTILFVPDLNVIFYRVTNQTRCAGLEEQEERLVVELNADWVSNLQLDDRHEMILRLQQDFVFLGIVAEMYDIKIRGVKSLSNGLMLPTPENYTLLEKERDILAEHYPGVHFTKNVDAFFADTLNDQLIKGLKIAALAG
ncbi:MAG: hypothetical protein KGP35_04340 [Bacteroidetes bacterium]|nr:hypothetical protein [Bacteroidota bacterium]